MTGGDECDTEGDVATGDVATIVELRARESCIAISTSIVRWRSLTSGSFGLNDLLRVGDRRGLGGKSVSLPELVRCRTGEWERSETEIGLMVFGEVESCPEWIDELSGGDAIVVKTRGDGETSYASKAQVIIQGV